MDQKLISDFSHALNTQDKLNQIQVHALLYLLNWDVLKAKDEFKIILKLLFKNTVDNSNQECTQNIISSPTSFWIFNVIQGINLRQYNPTLKEYLQEMECTFFIDSDTFKLNRTKYEKEIIQVHLRTALEASRILNWWLDLGICTDKLHPINTIGDGNCLLHAASISVWGYHDRFLFLRTEVNNLLNSEQYKDKFYFRWRNQITTINEELGLVYNEDEWKNEWNNIIKSTSCEPQTEKGNYSACYRYEALEEIHVYVLSHVLKRPIILYSDTMLKGSGNEPIAPNPFGGIYLPLEYNPDVCYKSPVLIAYDTAHFTAVVPSTMHFGQSFVPVTDCVGNILPIHYVDNSDKEDHFSTTKLEKNALTLLKQYMNILYDFLSDSDEDEIEQKFSETIELNESDPYLFASNKTRATKQIQNVAKQFGSIGKSMSRKLKNFSMKKTKDKKEFNDNLKIAYAFLELKPPPTQENLIHNYLYTSPEHFKTENENMDRKHNCNESEERKHSPIHDNNANSQYMIDEGIDCSDGDSPLVCVNDNCNNKSSPNTNYLCSLCFEKQLKIDIREKYYHESIQFGTGNSTFYKKASNEFYQQLKDIPKYKSTQDHTLYLSKSTFFNDSDVPSENYASNNENIDKQSRENFPPAVSTNRAINENVSEITSTVTSTNNTMSTTVGDFYVSNDLPLD